MRIFGRYDVLGRCTLCRRRRLAPVNLGLDIWACAACVALVNAAASAPRDPESIPFVGGPLAGAVISEWRGEPSPELYLVRGHDDLAASLPTDRPPCGIPREELGWYAFDDSSLGAYRWQGWLGGE
jgi:hypothetical protein